MNGLVKKARFIEAARREFLSEVSHYNSKQAGLGSRFSRAVEETVSLILSFPQAGSPSISDTRRILVKNFPYSLYYRAVKNQIVIFAVSHHARKPGYWSSRR